MKTYIIYVKGIEKGYLKAPNHNAAEKKAQKKYSEVKAFEVSVSYTELWYERKQPPLPCRTRPGLLRGMDKQRRKVDKY